MRKFLFIFLLLISSSVFSFTTPSIYTYKYGSYPFTSTNGQAACDSAAPYWYNRASGYYTFRAGTPIADCLYPTGSVAYSLTIIYSCPIGGTLYTSSGYPYTCNNVPSCLSPTVRSSSSPYSCFTPKECIYPESDNGSGVCAQNSCPVGQNRNPITNLCQTPPTCATAETYDTVKNACTLLPLHCPTHFHPSSTNDACLADPKLACPLGQHDDGTYLCVSDTSTACTSAQQYGTLNGVPQCVAKPNVLDTAQQVAQANETARVANAALALDPTNVTKQATALAANQAAGITSSNAQSSDLAQLSTGIDDLNQKATDAAKVLNDKLTADADALDAEIAEIDALKASNLGTNLIPEKSTFTSILLDSIPSYDQTASCPADIPIVLSFKTINFSLTRICELALGIRPLFLSLAWLAAGRIVFASMVS
jgi:hypothetical protein